MDRATRGVLAVALLWVAALAAGRAGAGTIEPGQERVVRGELSAVNVPGRVVVVEVPMGNSELTVGVTLDAGVQPLQAGEEVSLQDLDVGQRMELRYQRRGDRLVGLGLRVLR